MKLKIGMVGCGMIGRYHYAPDMRFARYAELAGICGESRAEALSFAEEMGIPKSYGTYEEMLGDRTIDAVIIATPNYLHCPYVISAAAAGKHVLCEKPMALDMEEAQRMVEACEKAGVVFMVAHHLRHKACNVKAAEMVKKGDIGRVATARVRWSFNHTGGEPETGWRTKKQLSGGGQIMNVNSHCVDLLVYILGKPVRVSAFIQEEENLEVENGSVIMIEFENGVIGIAEGSDREETEPSNLEIFGGGCSLIIEKACSTDKYGGLRRLPSGDFEKAEFDRSPYTLEVDHFAKAVIEKFEPISSGRKTLETMKVLMAAYESAETGKHICL